MNVQKKYTACNIKRDSNNYLKNRIVCKSCYNMKRRENNNKTLIKNQQPKIDNVNNNDNKGTLIIGFSNCGKTYLMNLIVHQKQEPIFIITESLNLYSIITAQTSDELQPLENYEKNSTISFWWYVTIKTKKQYWSVFYSRYTSKILIYTTHLKAISISLKILTLISLIYKFYLNKL